MNGDSRVSVRLNGMCPGVMGWKTGLSLLNLVVCPGCVGLPCCVDGRGGGVGGVMSYALGATKGMWGGASGASSLLNGGVGSTSSLVGVSSKLGSMSTSLSL